MSNVASLPRPARRLRTERLDHPQGLREAQALRFEVFSEAFGVQFEATAQGLDADDYDAHCRHIGVRDLDSGRLVATTRLLDQQGARQLGRFYSEEEFQLHGLAHLDGSLLEVGRTCVAPAYRNGATIALLWSELAEQLNQGGYRYLMGCASVSMADGGLQAHAIMRRVRQQGQLDQELLRAVPQRGLPAANLPDNLSAELPPLLRAYLRLGARVCGEPCWDPDFGTADLFVLLRAADLCPRYARHFRAAV